VCFRSPEVMLNTTVTCLSRYFFITTKMADFRNVWRLSFVLLFYVVFDVNGLSNGQFVSVVAEGQSLSIVDGKVFPNVAWAKFSNEIQQSG